MTERRGGDRGTEGAEPPARCAWCRRTLPEPAATGRPRLYCRRSCRQRAFEARRRLVELSWGEDRLRGLAERLDAVSVHLAGLDDLVRELRQDVDDGRADLGGRGADELVGRLEVLVDDLREAVDRGGPTF
ncbi:MAG: hypothetical protein ACOYOP_15585 [Microthrixaceae bacterium]